MPGRRGSADNAEELRLRILSDRAGNRVDLLLAETGFDDVAIPRAVELDVSPGLRARVCTAEDVIIYKLISTRPRDFEDARNVVLRQGKVLDQGHILKWLV
jgi:hypothetical protein